MTWFKVDDTLHSHKKAMRSGVEAMGLWVLAGSWAADQLTDGWVPSYAAERVTANFETLAAALVKAGLWVIGEHDGEPGWWFHEWQERQPTREEILARRKADADRRARWRNGKKTGGVPSESTSDTEGESQGVSRRDASGVSRPVSALPDPTRPDPKDKRKKTLSNQRLDGAPADSEFDAFWAAYPRREAKKGARVSFTKAVKNGTPADVLIAAATRYGAYVVAVGREREKIKIPTSWLNQGCWDDELEADGLAPVMPIEPVAWLRGLWQAADVDPIEKTTRLRYERPDLPVGIDDKQAVADFFRDHRRAWIDSNRNEILDQLAAREAAA